MPIDRKTEQGRPTIRKKLLAIIANSRTRSPDDPQRVGISEELLSSDEQGRPTIRKKLESTPDDGCVVRFTVSDEDAENFHFMGRNYEGVSDTWFATHEQLENASIELGDT